MAVNSLTRDTLSNTVKYTSMLAGNEPFDASSDFLISEQILTTSAAYVTFDVTGLDSTYKHLQIRGVGRNTASVGYDVLEAVMRLNGSTASYIRHVLSGDGSSVTSGSTTPDSIMIGLIPGSDSGSSKFGAFMTDILDAFSTVKNKTIRSFSSAPVFAGLLGPDGMIELRSGAWLNTSAITSITVYAAYGGNPNGSFTAGTRISLYGSKG